MYSRRYLDGGNINGGNTMNRSFVLLITILAGVIIVPLVPLYAQIPKDYQGTPFHNDSVKVFPIRIPGILQCEYYDIGGAGIAYGGTKEKVNGRNVGAEFNRTMGCNEFGTPYLCSFRDTEAVAVSYTKPCCDLDSARNMFPQVRGQIYTGWTRPGQWLNYTVYVDTPGVYSIHILCTAPLPDGFELTLALNSKTVVDRAAVPNSCHGDQKDGLRWHRWNKVMDLAEVTFPTAGVHLLTLTVSYPDRNETNDLGNFDYVEFVRKSSVPAAGR
jgi:hypothetical protein